MIVTNNCVKFALLGIVIAIFQSCAAMAAPSNRPISIVSDRGGIIIDYALRIRHAEDSGRAIKFMGRCDSACTLFLGMTSEQACVSDRASFGFHLPYGSSSEANARAAVYMMERYPEWVVEWIRLNGGLGRRTKRMDSEYAMQYLGTCQPD